MRLGVARCGLAWALTLALAGCAVPRSHRADTTLTLEQVVELLELEAHPEGGYFRQVYLADQRVDHPGIPPDLPRERATATAIYFLLGPGEFSAFHRIRWTDEVWHFYAGAPVEQHVIHPDGRYERWILGGDLQSAPPLAVVPAGALQAARVVPGGEWSLVGCTVAPGFDYADFELPTAAELIAAYPRHEAIIRELTRR